MIGHYFDCGGALILDDSGKYYLVTGGIKVTKMIPLDRILSFHVIKMGKLQFMSENHQDFNLIKRHEFVYMVNALKRSDGHTIPILSTTSKTLADHHAKMWERIRIENKRG